jgi:hypothetical protein
VVVDDEHANGCVLPVGFAHRHKNRLVAPSSTMVG